jgi:hypothetical protein
VTIESAVDHLKVRTLTLGRVAQLFAGTLERPQMDEAQGGFRYNHADHRHFCLLRACRIVSALSAAVELARGGFPQEIGVLHRVVQESASQIKAVLVQIAKDGKLSGALAVFVTEYFRDAARGPNQMPSAQPKLSQKYVNDLIGSELDPFSKLKPGDVGWKSTADRHWHVDWVFSNYVHGRYPETMDLFGGRPGRFHLHGMRGTPKDVENVEMLDALISSASLCFVRMIQTLNLRSLLQEDPSLIEWYRRFGDA